MPKRQALTMAARKFAEAPGAEPNTRNPIAGIINDATLNRPLESQRNFLTRAGNGRSTSPSSTEDARGFLARATSDHRRKKTAKPVRSTTSGTAGDSTIVATRPGDAEPKACKCRGGYRG